MNLSKAELEEIFSLDDAFRRKGRLLSQRVSFMGLIYHQLPKSIVVSILCNRLFIESYTGRSLLVEIEIQNILKGVQS